MMAMDLFRQGGPLMYGVLAIAVIGMVVGTALAVVTALRKWVPAAAWLAMPVTAAALGALGTLGGARLALRAVASAAPEESSAMAAQGWSIATYTDAFGLQVASSLLAATALFGGLTLLIGAGKESKWTLATGLPVLGLALPVGAGLMGWAVTMRVGPAPFLVGVVALVALLGCGLAGLRRPDDPKGPGKAAGARVLMWLCAVGSVLAAGQFGYLLGKIQIYRALAVAAPESKLALWAAGDQLAAKAGLVGLVGAGVVALLALVPVLPLVGRLAERRTLISAALCLVLLVPLLGVRMVTDGKMDELHAWTDVALYEGLQGRTEALAQARLPDGMDVPRLRDPHRPLLLLQAGSWREIGLDGELTDVVLPLDDRVTPTLIVPASMPASELASTALTPSGGAGLLVRGDWAPPPAPDEDPRGLGLSSVHVRLALAEVAPPPDPDRNPDAGEGAKAKDEEGRVGKKERKLEKAKGSRVQLQRAELDRQIAESTGLLGDLRAMEGYDEDTEGVVWLVEEAGQDIDEAARQLVRALKEVEPEEVRLVPGEGWTAQDVVTLCLAASTVEIGDSWRARGVPCVLSEEGPPPPPEIDQEAIIGLIGSQYGAQYGSGGLGSRGSGLGGGGTASGLGGLGTRGRGSSGYGRGGGFQGSGGSGGPGVEVGDPIILGALDKSEIDRVVKSHLGQIRYCYQRELTKNPSLFGKIVVKFVIAKDGSVSSAKTHTSTMANPNVEGCVNGRFLRFQFPQPKGGGIVIVTYPFIFKSS